MPTYYPTKGRENDTGTKIISRRDQAAHKKLKYRSMGQASSAEVGDREAILSKLQEWQEDWKRRRLVVLPGSVFESIEQEYNSKKE